MDPFNILNRLLDSKVEMAVGEVIGVSKELSNMFADSIRVKSAKSQVPVGLTTYSGDFRAKTRALLIRIRLECDGEPIEAIIDTGSQLNIVKEKVWKSKIKRPVSHQDSITMNDANGGEGTLTGIVENVPFTYGAVRTRANLYVGAHVPFDLLLGRLWQ